MKKLLVFLFVIAAIGVNAQSYSKHGYRTLTDTISNEEFSTLDSIKIGQPIQRQLDNRPTQQQLLDNSEDVFNNVYSKEKVDSIKLSVVSNNVEEAINAVSATKRKLPLSSYAAFTSSNALTDGTVYYILYEVLDTISVPSVSFITTSTTAAYTGDNYNGIGIYSVSGSTYTKVAETANDTEFWKTTSNTLATKSLPSPVTLTPGLWVVGFLYNSSAQTNAVTLTTTGTTNGLFKLLSASTHRISGSQASQTALPSSVSTASLSDVSQIYGIMLNYTAQ